ncbi:MAG TPA: carboxypeptidase-like regulatory domain-containing protein, partial [Chitinophagaceae bacterium]|nr:carboxypeptidase-like regulatory domain-containing protein [Chitinophagaceae bacterium]
SFPWLRVAALVIVFAGLGLLASKFVLNNKKSGDIAKLDKNATISNNQPGTTDTGKNASTPVDTKNNNSLNTTGNKNRETVKTETNNKSTAPVTTGNNKNGKVTATKDEAGKSFTVTSNSGNGLVPVPVKTTEQPVGAAREKVITKGDLSKEETKSVAVNQIKSLPGKDADGVADRLDEQQIEDNKNKNAVAANKKLYNERPNEAGYLNQSNTFRGRVTDVNNIGLPFARVYNPNDNNAGTYTDVTGNFNLTFPDSVLNVQVKSVGFETANVQLRNTTPNNQVIMQDDRKSLSEVVVSNQKPNATARSLNNNMKLEEPEPADGWDNYDTYLVNNLDIPEEIKTKSDASGQVQVSFEVNKEGEPVKFRIEKSLCGKCDKEAIRLIKQGPKWKRTTNKNGRTVVTISF